MFFNCLLRFGCRYTACGGLFNQHYCHVAALTVALRLGADVVLPHSVKRQSFNQYFNQDPNLNQVDWTAAPLTSLYDIPRLRAFLNGESRAWGGLGFGMPDGCNS